MPPNKPVPTSNPTLKKVDLTLRPKPLDQTKVNITLKKPVPDKRVPGAYVYSSMSGGGTNYA